MSCRGVYSHGSAVRPDLGALAAEVDCGPAPGSGFFHRHTAPMPVRGPTISRTFSTNSGSVDSLKVSGRCGCNPKARQLRWMVDGAYPTALAIERNDQCVAPGGVPSSVSRIVSAIS